MSETTSVLENFASKLGVALSSTGNAIFKDFLDGLDEAGWQKFKSDVQGNPLGAVNGFIDGVVKKIGYDISDGAGNECNKIREIFVSIIDTMMKVSDLILDMSNQDVLDLFINKKLEGEKKNGDDSLSKNSIRFGDILSLNTQGVKFGTDQLGGCIELDDSNDGGKGKLVIVKQTIELIQTLFDLCKKLSDIEWDEIANENEELGKYIKENYFTQDFAKRLVDYVFITFLKNAKDVFTNDLELWLDQKIEKAKNVGSEFIENVKNEIKEQLGDDVSLDKVKELLADYECYKDLLKTVEKMLMQNAGVNSGDLDELGEVADSTIQNIVDNAENVIGFTKNQLEIYKKNLRKKIETILDQVFPAYNTIGKVFNRVYAVFEFLDVISKKKVDVAKYLIQSESEGKSLCVEIPVFRWSAVQDLFVEPENYLKKTFPIANYQDAENLVVKITNLVRAFNKDFPQIESIKQFIWDLIFEISSRIETYSKESAKDIDDLKKSLEEIKNFLFDILKVCEAVAFEVVEKMKEGFKNYELQVEQDAKGILGDLKKEISEKIKNVNVVIDCSDEKFKSIVLDSFSDAVTENLNEFYEESNVKAAIESACNDDALNNLIDAVKQFANEEILSIKESFSEQKWNGIFDAFEEKIRNEFEKQTKNFPKTLDALKNFGIESIDSLLKGDSLCNPFSDFDFMAYYQIVIDDLDEISKLDIDSYYSEFKQKVDEFVEVYVNKLCEEIDSIDIDESKVKTLARDILQSWWSKARSKFIGLLVNPFADALKKVVHEWIGSVLQLVMESVSQLVDGTQKVLNTTKKVSVNKDSESTAVSLVDVSKNVENIKNLFGDSSSINVAEITDIINQILMFKGSDEDSWSTWKNVLKFALSVYKVIPDKIKQSLSSIIDVPDFKTITKYLPEYDFDAKNKFLAVTVLNKETEDISEDANGKANIVIQLLVFVGEKKDGEDKDSSEEGLFILPMVKGSFGVDFNVGKKHYMQFSTNGSVNADFEKKDPDDKTKSVDGNALGCFIKYTDKISETDIEWLADGDAFKGCLELLFKRGSVKKGKIETPESIEIFDSEIAKLTLQDYPQKFFVGYDNGFNIGYIGGLRDLDFVLKLKDQNDFFKSILKNDIEIKLEKLDLGYSLKDGFKVDSDTKVKIPINADIDLDAVKFKNIALELGFEGASLSSQLFTSFTADLKGIVITFTEMGLGINFNLPINGCKGFDISPKFTYPNGLGISIDVSGVKGGGAVQWDEKRQRFAGALELKIMEKVGASAMLVFTTGKGTDPFSFMGALCVYFNPGIQLGMGFSLEGIGGSFGVNRMISTDNLRSAVYDGTLESVLFYKDIVKNVDTVLANIDKYYPIKVGQMYFGFLGKIAWGTILKADLGLFIQAPDPVTIIVAGVVKVSISEKIEKLLVINACFLGGIQLDKGFFFDASLYDSKIVGIELHGDMAIRIYWGGETKGFILSIGGFHPSYKPEAGFSLPDLKRVGLKLNYSILKFSLDAYFAITSNTVQFGTNLNILIGWSKFGLTGYASFNALFQFNPFKFVVDVSAGLAVNVGGMKICSVDLSFELGGPAEWHAKGKASFWFLLVKISLHFDETWGKKQVASNRSRVDLLPRFTKEFDRKENWKLTSSDLTDNMVSLVKFDKDSIVLQPSDTLSFCQSVIPLDKDMECYGEEDLNDICKLEIEEVLIGDAKETIGVENTSFAPSLIKRLNEKQKLEGKSFVQMRGGFNFSSQEEKNGKCNVHDLEYKEDVEHSCDVDCWKLAANNIADVNSQPDSPASSKESQISNILEFGKVYKNVQTTNSKNNRVTRCSRRKSSSGFDRFTKQWDEFLYLRTMEIVKSKSN